MTKNQITKKNWTQKICTGKSTVFLVAMLCCMLWGSAYPCIKIGYELFEITQVGSKIVFAGYRFLAAGCITLVVHYSIHKKCIFPPKGIWPGIIILGFVQTFIQYVFFYIGLSHTTGVKASVLNAIGTFTGVLLAHFFYKNDRMNMQKIIGCSVGFIGIIVINLGQGLGHVQFHLTGEGFLVITGLAFAVGSLISKKISVKEGADTMLITGYQLVTGGLMLVLFGTLMGGRITHVTAGGAALFFYMATLSAVAFTLWMYLLQYNKMGKITVYNFLVPVFGSLLSGIFLHEDMLKLKNLFALVCVSCGIYLVNYVKNDMEK